MALTASCRVQSGCPNKDWRHHPARSRLAKGAARAIRDNYAFRSSAVPILAGTREAQRGWHASGLRRTACSAIGQLVSQGVQPRSSAIMDVGFRVDVRNVPLDGPHAQIKSVSDLAVGPALGYESQHL